MKFSAANPRRAWRWMLACLVFFLVAVSGCKDRSAQPHDYQIVVNGSTTPVPVVFTGSYVIQTNGVEHVHDLSGAGSFSTTFQGEYLTRVRLQVSSRTGLAALSVYEDGQLVFDSAPTDALTPIIFTNTR